MEALVASEMSYQTLLTLEVEKFDGVLKKFEEFGKSNAENKKSHTKSGPSIAKRLCALEVRLEKLKSERLIGANTGLVDYYKTITDAKPANWVLSMKNCFGSFVLTGLISEADYDKNSGNTLQWAGRILGLVGGDLTHAVIEKVAFHLKDRSDAAPKELKKLHSALKPQEKITEDEAKEKLQDIADANHLLTLIGEIPRLMEESPVETQRLAYQQLMASLFRYEAKNQEKVQQWDKEDLDAENAAKQKPTALAAPMLQAA